MVDDVDEIRVFDDSFSEHKRNHVVISEDKDEPWVVK